MIKCVTSCIECTASQSAPIDYETIRFNKKVPAIMAFEAFPVLSTIANNILFWSRSPDNYVGIFDAIVCLNFRVLELPFNLN